MCAEAQGDGWFQSYFLLLISLLLLPAASLTDGVWLFSSLFLQTTCWFEISRLPAALCCLDKSLRSKLLHKRVRGREAAPEAESQEIRQLFSAWAKKLTGRQAQV